MSLYLINEMFENASKLSTAGKHNVALDDIHGGKNILS